VSSDNFVIVDETTKPRVVGEVDYTSAFSTLHEKAIYIVEGQQFFVEHFDHTERRATVRQCETDYFTDAVTTTKVNILDRFDSGRATTAIRSHGEVHVVSQVVGFKKIKFYTMENVGSGELEMPEQEMHTTSYWLTVPREVLASVEATSEQKRDGIVGLANTMKTVAMLFLMCDQSDIGVALGDNSQGTASVEKGFKRPGRQPSSSTAVAHMGPDYEPNVFIYDNYPGGIGFSEPLFRLHAKLLQESRKLIESCPCLEGCPSCVGPAGEVGAKGKEVALAILEHIVEES
jgi:DEAD/DEAH box helicase domain-containing protein